MWLVYLTIRIRTPTLDITSRVCASEHQSIKASVHDHVQIILYDIWDLSSDKQHIDAWFPKPWMSTQRWESADSDEVELIFPVSGPRTWFKRDVGKLISTCNTTVFAFVFVFIMVRMTCALSTQKSLTTQREQPNTTESMLRRQLTHLIGAKVVRELEILVL